MALSFVRILSESRAKSSTYFSISFYGIATADFFKFFVLDEEFTFLVKFSNFGGFKGLVTDTIRRRDRPVIFGVDPVELCSPFCNEISLNKTFLTLILSQPLTLVLWFLSLRKILLF